MPVYEGQKKGWGWPAYVAIGCGGCAVLVVLFLVGTTLFGLYFAKKGMNQVMSGTMQGSESVSIALPDAKGTIIYWFNPLGTPQQGASGGNLQGLRLVCPPSKEKKWLLPTRERNLAQLEVHWYPAAGGNGPFATLKDVEGEVAVDVTKREAGFVQRSGGRVHVTLDSFPMPGDSESSMIVQTSGAGTTTPSAGSQDVTAAFAASKHLGTIVRKGNKLVFVPSGSKP